MANAISATRNVIANISRGITTFLRKLGHDFWGATRRALHDTGSFTYQIETEVTHTKPPAFAKLSMMAKVLYWPLLVLALPFSLLLLPFIGHGIKVFIPSFKTFSNLGLAPRRQFTNIKAPTLQPQQTLYALPGYLVGVICGGGFALVAGFGRTLYHTWLNIVLGTRYGIKAALPAGPAIPDKRRPIEQFMGIFGLPLGLFVGALCFIGISSWRVLKHTAITQTRTFLNMIYPLVADEAKPKFDVGRDTRRRTDKWLGAPLGYLLGGLGGLILGYPATLLVRMATNTPSTISYWVTNCINAALPTKQPWPSLVLQRPWNRAVLGSLIGLPLGLAIGLPCWLGTYMGMVVIRGWQSMQRITFQIWSFALAKENVQRLQPDQRSWSLQYILGHTLIGVPLGLVVGVLGALGIWVGRIAIHSVKNWIRAFCYCQNLCLAKENQLPTLPPDTRSLARRCMGIIGWLIAIPTIPLIMIGTLIVRSAVNSFDIGTRIAYAMCNWAALPNNKRTYRFKDLTIGQRTLGLPGYVFGALVGVVCVSGIFLRRYFVNTYESTKRVVFAYLHAALPANVIKLTKDARSLSQQRWGYVGQYCLGHLMGAPLWVGIITTRSLIHSCLTTFGQSKYVFDCLWAGKMQQPPADPRTPIQRQLGYPGYLLSMVTVPVTALVTGLILSVIYSTQTMLETISLCHDSVAHFDLDNNIDQRYCIKPGKRALIHTVFSLPGYLPGLVFGLIDATAVGLYRIIGNGLIDLYHRGRWTYNLICLPKDSVSATPDLRPWNQKLMGWQLLPINLPIIAVGASLVLFGRGLMNSAESTARIVVASFNAGLNHNRFITVAPDKRNLAQLYVFGAPGLILGIALSAISLPLGLCVRIAEQSALSARNAFLGCINLSLPQKHQFKLPAEPRNSYDAFIFGGLGLLLGGCAGCISFILLESRHFFIHTYRSFISLSGLFWNAALINCSETIPRSRDFSNDNRSLGNQLLGGLGYLGAVATTGIIAASVLLVRGLIWVGTLVLMLVLSPIGGIARSCDAAEGEYLRQPSVDDSVTQQFRRIHRSLDYAGRLPEGQPLQAANRVPTMQETVAKETFSVFMLKSLQTENDKLSATERTIKRCFEAYRQHITDTGRQNDFEFFNDTQKHHLFTALRSELTRYRFLDAEGPLDKADKVQDAFNTLQIIFKHMQAQGARGDAEHKTPSRQKRLPATVCGMRPLKINYYNMLLGKKGYQLPNFDAEVSESKAAAISPA